MLHLARLLDLHVFVSDERVPSFNLSLWERVTLFLVHV